MYLAFRSLDTPIYIAPTEMTCDRSARVLTLKLTDAMNQLVSFIVHPLLSLNLWSDDDDEPGIDVLYLLSAFFAIGIWLVFERYQHARNSAKPFRISIPAVRFFD